MKRFITLFLCFVVCGTLIAKTNTNSDLPVYKRQLETITFHNGGQIILNDESVWEIVSGKERDLRLWEKGDEIDILWSPPMSKGVFCLSNSKHEGHPKAILKPASMKHFPTVVEILEEGSYVVLSDHSLWKFNWWGKTSTKDWEVGQHILIQGRGSKNNYSFNNLDIIDDSHFNSKYASGTFIKFE